jgi:hypothetical protein
VHDRRTRPGGKAIKVTSDNKEEDAAKTVDLRLKRQIREQVMVFCERFYEFISVEEIRKFSPSELDLLIGGVPEIDVADFVRNCEFNPPYSRDHRVIRLFFDTIRNWDNVADPDERVSDAARYGGYGHYLARRRRRKASRSAHVRKHTRLARVRKCGRASNAFNGWK